MKHTVGTTGTTSGTKRCYEMLRGTTRDTSRTAMYYEIVLSYCKWYYEILRGTTSHYEALQVVPGGTTR